MKNEELQLVIDAFTPETLPMSRLAEYLREFATLLGNEEHVHFSRLKKNSTHLLAFPDFEAIPKVKARIDEVISGTAPKPALAAHRRLDDLLAADNAIGHIEIGGAKVIEFPGRRRPIQEKIGPVRRAASVEGQVYQIGGKDETINIHLLDKGHDVRAEVSITLARKLAPYLLLGRVRLFGEGDWYRINSRWERTNFTATDFVPLNSQSLPEALREVQGIFTDVSPDDFAATMSELRNG